MTHVDQVDWLLGKRILVSPASMIWSDTLTYSALFYVLHD